MNDLQRLIERDVQLATSWNDPSVPGQYPLSMFNGSPPPVIHGEHWRATLSNCTPTLARYWIHVDLQQAREAASARSNQP